MFDDVKKFLGLFCKNDVTIDVKYIYVFDVNGHHVRSRDIIVSDFHSQESLPLTISYLRPSMKPFALFKRKLCTFKYFRLHSRNTGLPHTKEPAFEITIIWPKIMQMKYLFINNTYLLPNCMHTALTIWPSNWYIVILQKDCKGFE